MPSCGILDSRIANTPIAILDFETTGLTPGIDRVVEASVVRIDPGGRPRLVFDTLINPNRRMSATDIHGITDQDVADAPRFEDVAADFLEAVSGCVVAAYNVYFDIRFFSFEFGRLGLSTLPPHFCLMYLRPMLGMGGRCRLAEACVAHGLPYEDQHIAAADCEASALLMNLYLKTMQGRGVVTFADLAALKSYKFTKSFRNDTFGRFPELGSCDPSKLKSRRDALVCEEAVAALPKTSRAGENKEAGLRAYWDTLCDAVSDLDLEESELAALATRRFEFGLSEEQVRAVHTKVYMSVLAEYADDWIITAEERESLRRLHECLRKAGWAPGD